MAWDCRKILQGTQGMGLHIMNYRAGMIGGRLKFDRDTAAGNGRYLHVSDEQVSDVACRMTELTKSQARRPRSKKKTVFVVDDHPSCARAWRY